jgi:hypothetical protein
MRSVSYAFKSSFSATLKSYTKVHAKRTASVRLADGNLHSLKQRFKKKLALWYTLEGCTRYQ